MRVRMGSSSIYREDAEGRKLDLSCTIIYQELLPGKCGRKLLLNDDVHYTTSHGAALFDVKLENIFLMELNEDLLEAEG